MSNQSTTDHNTARHPAVTVRPHTPRTPNAPALDLRQRRLSPLNHTRHKVLESTRRWVLATLAIVFLVVLLLNLIPAFAPPTWMVMSWIGFNIDHGRPLLSWRRPVKSPDEIAHGRIGR